MCNQNQGFAKAGMSLASWRGCTPNGWNQMRWRKQSQAVRGLVGQGGEHTGDSKCNWKPLEGSREKWACPDLNICKKKKEKENFPQAVMQKVD